MNPFLTAKAANLRRALGIVLFAAMVGVGISLELIERWGSPMGWLIIVLGGVGLIFWGAVTARRMAETGERGPGMPKS